MIGLSYQKKAQETLTSQSSYDVMSADNDDQLEEFMKLYDIMLPFATWNKKQNKTKNVKEKTIVPFIGSIVFFILSFL